MLDNNAPSVQLVQNQNGQSTRVHVWAVPFADLHNLKQTTADGLKGCQARVYTLQHIYHRVLYPEAVQEAIDSVLPRANDASAQVSGAAAVQGEGEIIWDAQDDYDGERLARDGKETMRKVQEIRKRNRRGWRQRGDASGYKDGVHTDNDDANDLDGNGAAMSDEAERMDASDGLGWEGHMGRERVTDVDTEAMDVEAPMQTKLTIDADNGGASRRVTIPDADENDIEITDVEEEL